MPAQCPLPNPPGQTCEHVCRRSFDLPGQPRIKGDRWRAPAPAACASLKRVRKDPPGVDAKLPSTRRTPAKERSTPASERPPPGARHLRASTLDAGCFRRPQRGVAGVRSTLGNDDELRRRRTIGVRRSIASRRRRRRVASTRVGVQGRAIPGMISSCSAPRLSAGCFSLQPRASDGSSSSGFCLPVSASPTVWPVATSPEGG